MIFIIVIDIFICYNECALIKEETMKKIKLRSILLVVLTIGLFWYILKDNFRVSLTLLLSSNIWYLLFAIVTYIIYFFVEAYLLYLLINKVNNSYSYKQTLELNLMTKFFNGVTPFSLGGQPFQVYELSKSKVRVTESLLVIVENFIVLQISMTIMSLISLGFCLYNGFVPTKLLWILTIIGVFITIVSFFMAIFMGLKINCAKKVGKWFINILNKLHILKSKDESYLRWTNKCDEYNTSFRILLKDKMFIIKCIFLNILYMSIFCMIPFFVFKALNINISINIFYVIILSCFIYISASFIPIPGASVGMEYSFINYFKLIISESLIMPGVLLWRLISYYIPMIIGGILFNIKDSMKK